MSESNSLYNRQSTLNLLSYETVIVVGCGGIGNWVALDLALCGRVSNLYLIDPDVVETSNLNRTIFRFCDIGKYKVDALCDIIFSRRPQQNISKYVGYMTDMLADKLIENVFNNDNSYYHSEICIVDCRDDVYTDCYKLNCKLYKVGYDGMSITIDGNPRLTHVFGQRGGSYSVTPSYIGSAQMAAMLVCNDMIYPKICRGQYNATSIMAIKGRCSAAENFPYLNKRVCYEYDELGRLNECVTIPCCSTIPFKYYDGSNDYVCPESDFSNLPNNKENLEDE